MLEEIGEPLRPVGRLERHARGHGPGDEEELPLDGGRHTAGPSLDDRIETLHGPIQALQHGELRVPAIPVLREQDDLSHAPIMKPPSDTVASLPQDEAMNRPEDEVIRAFEAECVRAVRSYLEEALRRAAHADPRTFSMLARGRVVRSVGLAGWWPDTKLITQVEFEDGAGPVDSEWPIWGELVPSDLTPEDLGLAWILGNIIVTNLEEP